MDKYDKIIFVTGATGKQGGATARHLIKNGWQVRALTRDTSKPSARALAEMGCEVVGGSLDDKSAIERFTNGIYGVFSVQALEEGIDAEIRRGKMLADIARQQEVGHFVYNSVGGADRQTGIPHFESKWQIEEHIRSLGLPYTILRPVFFMDNFLMPKVRASLLDGVLSFPMKPDKPLQMIAVDDIGGFVETVFDQPDTFICKAMEIAGDELTMPRAAELLGRYIGREVKFIEMPIEQMRHANPDYATMFEWFNEFGYDANINTLCSMYPELKKFEQWAQEVNWQQYAEQAGISQKK